MYIVIDEKIPFLKEALEAMGHAVLSKAGAEICAADVANADALFVRTRTRCNAALLAGSQVRFIGTATIGYDHIDAAYCDANSIKWASAVGCNSWAVLQYVQSTLYFWAKERGVNPKDLVMGVVGVGEIGSKVAQWAKETGMTVLLNDPPREQREGCGFVSLAEIAERCNVITFHPTLTKEGQWPSFHLADSDFFSSLRQCRLFINASRGPVVDNKALKDAIATGAVGDVVLDVWESEPHIDMDLLDKVYIGTPHIAGYSLEGKINATRTMLHTFAKAIGFTGEIPYVELPSPAPDVIAARDFPEAALKIYSPYNDSLNLKRNPGAFEELRNNYLLRRETCSFKLLLEK